MRWEDPRHGLRPPADFIPLAEQSGLILPLTWFVLNRALAQTKEWQKLGLSLTVSVNVPAQMLNDLDFPNRVANTLEELDFPPGKLILEVTETGAMVDSAATIESLTRLRVKGIGLSIDDFGTGYSSLVELYRMPFNELKIDKSFVMECDHSVEARTIVEAIVGLGHKLGMSVCAEGVETEAVLRFLQELGCERAQGFLYSRPLPAARVAAFAARARVESSPHARLHAGP